MKEGWAKEAERWMMRVGFLPSSGAKTPDEKADLASLRNLLEAVWQDGKKDGGPSLDCLRKLKPEHRSELASWLRSRAREIEFEREPVQEEMGFDLFVTLKEMADAITGKSKR